LVRIHARASASGGVRQTPLVAGGPEDYRRSMVSLSETVDGHRPILGRRSQLAALTDALSRMEARGSPVIAISGEPGIGKTRLVEELCERADARGHLVLSGRAADLERDLPFAVAADALGDYAASLGVDRLQRLVGAQAGELAPIVAGLEGLDGASVGRLQDERFQTHRAVRALLEALGATTRVVLALDDLHWADGASLELVAHLLRRPPRRGVLLVLAFRPAPAQPALVDALAAGARDGTVVELLLQGLDRAEAEALLCDRVPPATREALFEQSGGNPFYLQELARAASPAAVPGGDVPRSVALALDQEVRGLPDRAQRLARACAVVGDPIVLDVAIAAADLDEGPALDALDALLGAALLAPTDVPRRYRFRHPLVRRAVYDTTAEGWRLGAHARAARALEAHGASLITRAHHLERCAQPGDQAAIGVLVGAGTGVAARAPEAAAGWYAAALRLLPDDAESAGQRLGLLVVLAQCQAATGQLELALASLTDALELTGEDETLGALRARLVAGCAMCENLLGRHEAAHGRLVSALDHVADPRSAAAADLQVELAADALYDADFSAMRLWAGRGLDIAVARDEPALALVAESLVCFSELGLGAIDDAQASGQRAARRLDGLGDDVLAGRIDGPYYLGFAEYFAERYDEAIRHFRRGLAVSRASGQGQFATPMTIGLAHACEVTGRLRAGLEHAEAAVEAGRLSGNRQVLCWALTAEAWIAAIAGDLPRARAAGADAMQMLGELDESVLSRGTRVHVAAALLEAGEPDRCLEAMADAGGPEFTHVEPGRRAWLYGVLARAELELGHAVVAEGWIARGEELQSRLGLSHVEGAVAYAHAVLHLHGGDTASALAQAQRAERCATRAGAAVQAARARTVAGRAAAAAGDRQAAAGWLERAEADLAAMGAVRLRDEAARELRRLGQRVGARRRRAPAGAEGLKSLSGREREIAELVADGRTNREIAAELFLSQKTIETHLTKVYAKLGASGRVAVAAAVGRERDPGV
jgi:DNA-binding CsgD family transcriptional regulator/tetratricopeptide (TPR) repeat protein